jgi:hypothetical protein
MLLFVIVVASLLWMHISIRRMGRNSIGANAAISKANEQLAQIGGRA